MANPGARAILLILIVGSGLRFPEPAAAQPAPAAPATSVSQEGGRLHRKFSRDLPWYDPLRAEPHEGKVQLLIPAWAKAFPQSMRPGTRFSWQITLGREIPIVAVSTQIADGEMNPNEWGLGLWTPVR